MSTKWKKTKRTENEGKLHVAKLLNDFNCIFNKVDGSNDIGLDGYDAFIDKESATGLCIGIQIKSGNSYNERTVEQSFLQTEIIFNIG
jgi:hypothetical protein